MVYPEHLPDNEYSPSSPPAYESLLPPPPPVNECPPPYESLLERTRSVTFAVVHQVKSKSKKLIALYICVAILTVVLICTFIYQYMKTDNIDGKLDDLKNIHMKALEEKVEDLTGRELEVLQTLDQLQTRLQNSQDEIKRMNSSLSRVSTGQDEILAQITELDLNLKNMRELIMDISKHQVVPVDPVAPAAPAFTLAHGRAGAMSYSSSYAVAACILSKILVF